LIRSERYATTRRAVAKCSMVFRDTFEEARVDPQELIETPLTLIVQQPTDIPTEPRQLERGFADTALSHS
uniref:Acyl-CoA dehydrogenase n=1 Tax=Gongylonema pulchrum TaxID=637853 RepID=A0A183DT54_9BILA